MAIFVVDQFSLNTDLPLDIRYAPQAGTYFDVSTYWHPGMQVYQTIDQKIWYADNSLNWHPISEGVDASLNQLYSFVTDLSLYVNKIDASLYSNTQLLNVHEASIGNLTARVILLVTNHDTSIANLDTLTQTHTTQITTINASLNVQTAWNQQQDASIARIDSSIASLDTLTQTHTSQIVTINASLNVQTAWNQQQDASIVNLRTNIDTSLALYVLKAGDTMTGPLIIDSSLLVDGNATVTGNLGVRGNLVVDGSTVFVQTTTVEVSTNFVLLNTGLTGTPPSWLQSGLIIERGDSSSYAIIFDETDLTFRVGIINGPDASNSFSDFDTQAVATRQDLPIADGIAIWNNAQNRFDTFTGLTYVVNSGLILDASLKLDAYSGIQDLMLVVGVDGYVKAVPTADASLQNIYDILGIHEASIGSLTTRVTNHDTSIANLDILTQELDLSINALFNRSDTSVLGAINIGDGSAAVYAGLTNDGSLQFREIVGTGAVIVTQNSNLVEISIDASFGGVIHTASNIGGGEDVFAYKSDHDLRFKTITSLDPSFLIITSDVSNLYIDISLGGFDVDASLSGLTDVSINELAKVTHQIIEWDSSIVKWTNTNGILWDTSLATTTDDVGGIPAGTDLSGLTLKEILFKLLYEYQVPTLAVGSNPVSGIYEKGITATQFVTIDVSWYSTNVNYPLALLNNVHISKTGAGNIFDTSLGLVTINASTYTDIAGITNWGGANRTISYNVSIDDNQSGQSQPAIGSTKSFTFYYKQYWGEVLGTTLIGDVSSGMIKTLDSSRLAGETDLAATFTYISGPKIKYLFVYPDTITAPDNFGILSQILDQNDFDITNSWDTAQYDVSVGLNNVRYRVYLLKNKVDTPTFDVTFRF
jgi:hypothetical protein